MNYLYVARKLLRFHGGCLMLLGLGNATASYLATRMELQGPFHFLFSDPFPEVGFLQAYLLAALVGFTILLGSNLKNFFVFDIVGILMHTIPPITLILMYDHIHSIMGPGTIKLSIAIHSSFVLLELVALGFYFKGARTHVGA